MRKQETRFNPDLSYEKVVPNKFQINSVQPSWEEKEPAVYRIPSLPLKTKYKSTFNE